MIKKFKIHGIHSIPSQRERERERERERGREGEMYKQEINHPDTFYITPHLPFEPSFVLIEYPSSIAALSQFLMKENVYREGIFFNTQYHLPLIGDGCRPPFEET